MGEIATWVVVLGLIGWVVKLVMFPPRDAQDVLTPLGVKLSYQYRNSLGIDTEGGRVYAMGVLYDRAEIRRISTDSIHEAKTNAVYGFTTHKDKRCKLVLHTTSIENPLVEVPFGNKKDMDEWYARLGAFLNLS